MMSMLPLVVGVPLVAAITTTLFASQRWCSGLSICFAALQLAVIVLLLASDSVAGDDARYTLGGWGAPLGIDLAVDGLSLIFLVLTSLLALLLGLYSADYFSAAKTFNFWPLWWLLISGINASFIAADVFNIYVALEIIGLSAVALVALSGTSTALTAALRYALVGLLGSLCYLFGVALLYRAYGSLDLIQLAAMAQHEPITAIALGLITVGLLLKTALLPLHFWLPAAHASAPAPVSAILSALVVKATFCLLLRFWLDILDPVVTLTAANLLGLLGALAIVWGCIAAYRAKRLKLMVAYSTVAQLGYLFLLFPLAITTEKSASLGSPAVVAVAYFMIAHALAKTAMFLAAGSIQIYYGHDDIDKLQGLAQAQPWALATFTIAGISLIGLPPSGGFIGKWLMLNVAIDNGQWWWVIVMLAGGLLAATYIVRVITIAFTQSDVSPVNHTVAVSISSLRRMVVYGLLLALAAVAIGFNTQWIFGVFRGDGSLSGAAV